MTIHIVCESNKFCFYKHDHFDKRSNQLSHSSIFERSQPLLSSNGLLFLCIDIKVVHEKDLVANPFLQAGEAKSASHRKRAQAESYKLQSNKDRPLTEMETTTYQLTLANFGEVLSTR